MSDEYLFDKQGTDGEIERLEKMLSAYRLEPNVPKLPNLAPGETSNRRFGWFRLGYAFAFASLVVVLAAGVITIQFPGGPNKEVTSISPVEIPEIERPFIAPSATDRAAINGPAVNGNSAVDMKKAKKPVLIVLRRFRRPTANNLIAAKTPRLTKEEKYAYDQLKVALWITGSKLKVVQDTIDRVDDQKTQTANEKR